MRQPDTGDTVELAHTEPAALLTCHGLTLPEIGLFDLVRIVDQALGAATKPVDLTVGAGAGPRWLDTADRESNSSVPCLI